MKMNLKTLLISSRSDLGGGPKHLADLCSKLADFQIEPFLAVPKGGPYEQQFKDNSSHIINIPHRKFSIISFTSLLLLCRRENINTIHSHGRGAGIYSRLLALFGLKVIHTFHGAHNERSILGQIKVYTDKFLKHLTQQFICVSKDESIQALSLGIATKDKLNIIENGVNQEKLRSEYNASSSQVIRERFHFKDNDIIFGFLSRLTYQKGIDQFIKNFPKSTPVNYKFVFAGEGDLEENLKELIEANCLTNQIFLYGSTNNPSEFLKSIDIYFSTSRWEGLPLGVLEALSLGKVCLLSDVTGHKTINKPNYNSAVLYDLENIHEKINFALENKDKISQEAVRLAHEFYSLNQMVRKTASLIST